MSIRYTDTGRMEKAAAIHYSQDLPAPVVLASGKGMLARRIVEIAEREGIQIMDKSDLADALVELPVGSMIPEDLYRIVAEILIYVRSVS